MKTQLYQYIIAMSLISNLVHANQIHDLMWGLKNKGGLVTIDWNPLQTYRVQAVAGEDINLAMPVQGRKIKVAVIDTGMDITHPSLSAHVTRNGVKCAAYEALKQCMEVDESNAQANKCRGEILNAPENVYPADCHGWSILDADIEMTPNQIIGRPDFKDDAGHGTHVAGIIKSVTDNVELIPVQVIGEGPNQPIKPYSLDLSPSENVRGGYSTATLSERISRGIIYAINSGAEVINLSIGWPESDNTDIIKAAISEAQRRGIIIVAAAGNDSTNAILRPCQFKGVICVAAHAPDGSIAGFSNFGYGVDIAAPGVEIVSTIPLEKRSVRIPGYRGYDALSGTSQATPFVTGVVADMLSRGIPARDIYPRLIVGARPVKTDLPVLVGPRQATAKAVSASTLYNKNILSGLLDMKNSLAVPKQALILPADKETQVINWDRQSRRMRFPLHLKNYWAQLESGRVQISARPTIETDIEAQVIQVAGQNGLNQWRAGEEKRFFVDLTIQDQSDAALSRIPSELSYQISVYINGVLHREFEVKAEIIVNVTEALAGAGVQVIPVAGEIPRDMKLSLVDEVLDQRNSQRDYFIFGKDETREGTFNIGLVRHDQNSYRIERSQNITFNGDIDMSRPQYKIRGDLDGDGRSEYIFGLVEFLDKDRGIQGDYRNHFYIFDDQMNLKNTILFDDKRASMPFVFYWMKVNGKLRPAWVGRGQEIIKSYDVTDLWPTDGNPDSVANGITSHTDIHFYYLNEEFKLDQIKPDNPKERIVDVLQPSQANAREGIVTVLVAQNLGTDLKPSYINQFSISNIVNGRISGVRQLGSLGLDINYRNLVDTFNDKTMSLKSEATEFRGLMWYGLDAGQKQRVTMLDPETMQLKDKLITSQRQVYDNALMIKSGFQSPTRQGAFVITNSELEYHDLNSNHVVSTSLNRYSFFGAENYIALFFPITLVNSQNPSEKWPAVFTTEGSGLSRGIRVLTAIYDDVGKLKYVTSPARLRLKADKGCRALEAPVFLGGANGYAMDYYCGNQIRRVLLEY